MKKVARAGNKARFLFRTKFQKSTPVECSFFVSITGVDLLWVGYFTKL